jgi:septum formation protein
VLILASASPRRRDLLAGAGVAFEVLPAEIDEAPQPGEAPEALAERLAREKALAVARRVGAPPPRLVLGSDTIVVLGAEVLGKPRDARHAEELLGRLVGRVHRVVTGVALAESAGLGVRSLTVSSRVTMHPAGAEEIRRYVAGGEPLDKAGAYALQGEGRRFVAGVEGSESNVIGLPLEETLALLRAAGAA